MKLVKSSKTLSECVHIGKGEEGGVLLFVVSLEFENEKEKERERSEFIFITILVIF